MEKTPKKKKKNLIYIRIKKFLNKISSSIDL